MQETLLKTFKESEPKLVDVDNFVAFQGFCHSLRVHSADQINIDFRKLAANGIPACGQGSTHIHNKAHELPGLPKLGTLYSRSHKLLL